LQPDRMPPIPAENMSAEQQAAASEIAAGRRGELSGPFVPALRSPELMRRLQRLGEYLRYDQSLEPRLREMVILLTARTWMQEYEWHVHAPIAREAGLAPAIIDAIRRGVTPSQMSEAEGLVYEFFDQLQRTRSIGDELYSRAVAALGEHGVIDLLATVGYYSTLAMIMNVARTPLPEGHQPLLMQLLRAD
jgi:4-carboxymuconolactone decarboxylase